MDAAATADGEVLAVEVGVFEGVGCERVEVEVGVGVEVLLEVRDALFEGVDFRDGALEREAERIHGAFEAFEKIQDSTAARRTYSEFLSKTELEDFPETKTAKSRLQALGGPLPKKSLDESTPPEDSPEKG
jgi:hypothetical protein